MDIIVETNIKDIFESALSQAEKFLFTQYFKGSTLKEIRRQNDLSGFKLPKNDFLEIVRGTVVRGTVVLTTKIAKRAEKVSRGRCY